MFYNLLHTHPDWLKRKNPAIIAEFMANGQVPTRHGGAGWILADGGVLSA